MFLFVAIFFCRLYGKKEIFLLQSHFVSYKKFRGSFLWTKCINGFILYVKITRIDPETTPFLWSVIGTQVVIGGNFVIFAKVNENCPASSVFSIPHQSSEYFASALYSSKKVNMLDTQLNISMRKTTGTVDPTPIP